MEENTEEFKELCRQAATEQDPAKLIVLVQEINRLLDLKSQRLRDQRSNPFGNATTTTPRSTESESLQAEPPEGPPPDKT